MQAARLARAEDALDVIAHTFGNVVHALVLLRFAVVGDADLVGLRLAIVDLAAHRDRDVTFLIGRAEAVPVPRHVHRGPDARLAAGKQSGATRQPGEALKAAAG